jgi:hypothetical protein
MEDILHLCRNVFPWFGKLATLLGRETQDNRFAHLGGELFILAKQIPYSDQEGINSKLFKVAELVNKACSVSERLTSLRGPPKCIKTYNLNRSLPRSREINMLEKMGCLMRFRGYWSAWIQTRPLREFLFAIFDAA